MYDFSPWHASKFVIFLVFIVSLIIFHLCLILKWQLSSISWKQVDYIWLLMAFLGIMGAIASNRQMMASTQVAYAELRLKSAQSDVMGRAQFGLSNVVCGKFLHTEYSPPLEDFNRMQKEHSEQCEWFKALNEKLGKISTPYMQPMRIADLVGIRPQGGSAFAYENFDKAIENYNAAFKEYQAAVYETEATLFELILKQLGPLLIALALSLRITKVSAEIIAEKEKLNFNKRK